MALQLAAVQISALDAKTRAVKPAQVKRIILVALRRGRPHRSLVNLRNADSTTAAVRAKNSAKAGAPNAIPTWLDWLERISALHWRECCKTLRGCRAPPSRSAAPCSLHHRYCWRRRTLTSLRAIPRPPRLGARTGAGTQVQHHAGPPTAVSCSPSRGDSSGSLHLAARRATRSVFAAVLFDGRSVPQMSCRRRSGIAADRIRVGARRGLR